MVRIGLLVLLLGTGTAWAGEPIGTASIVRGAAQVQPGGEGAWEVLRPGAPVRMGDRVRTGASGEVRLSFRDGSTMNLSARSEIMMDEYVYQPGTSRRSRVSLLRGRLRATVSRMFQDDEVEVRTPTAVAGVRGTDFTVEVVGTPERERTSRTRVVVFDGQVAVRNAWEELRDEVMLEAGQGSVVAFQRAPDMPQSLTPQRLREVQRATTVRSRGTLRDTVPEEHLRSLGADVGPQPAAPLIEREGLPPINQQSTDAHRDSTLSIRIRVHGAER